MQCGILKVGMFLPWHLSGAGRRQASWVRYWACYPNLPWLCHLILHCPAEQMWMLVSPFYASHERGPCYHFLHNHHPWLRVANVWVHSCPLRALCIKHLFVPWLGLCATASRTGVMLREHLLQRDSQRLIKEMHLGCIMPMEWSALNGGKVKDPWRLNSKWCRLGLGWALVGPRCKFLKVHPPLWMKNLLNTKSGRSTIKEC